MPAGRPGLSWINLLLLLNASTVALQQQPQDGRPPSHRGSPLTVKHGAAQRSSSSATPRIDVSYNHFRDTHPSPASGFIANKNNNERAVATVALAESSAEGGAVRHPQHLVHPERSAAGPTSGLKDISARSLQDWEVEDLVLLVRWPTLPLFRLPIQTCSIYFWLYTDRAS